MDSYSSETIHFDWGEEIMGFLQGSILGQLPILISITLFT